MVPGPDQSFVSASHEHGGTFPGRSGREGLFRHLLLHSPFLPSGPLPSLRFNQRLPGIPRRSLVPHSQDREDHRYPHPREVLSLHQGDLPPPAASWSASYWRAGSTLIRSFVSSTSDAGASSRWTASENAKEQSEKIGQDCACRIVDCRHDVKLSVFLCSRFRSSSSCRSNH